MSDIKKRIVQYLNNQGFKTAEIVKKISVSDKYFNSKGAVGSDVLEKISFAFPELNMDWVITGRMPILHEAEILSQLKESKATYKTDKDITIELLHQALADKQKIIEMLEQQLAKKTPGKVTY